MGIPVPFARPSSEPGERQGAMGIRTALAVVGMALGVVAGGQAGVQDYPSRPIRLVVPFAASGATDVLAWLVGAEVTARPGRQAVVDNRPGAGGNIGAAQVAKAEPDATPC